MALQAQRKFKWPNFYAAGEMRLLRTTCKLLLISALCSVPASAQLVSYVSDRGTVVFTNDNSPVPQEPVAAGKAGTSSSTSSSTSGKPEAASGMNAVAVPAGAKSGLVAAKTPVTPQLLDKIVLQTAEKNHVDPELVRAVISTESNWNTGAVSSKGALGLMQLVPGTARLMGVGNAFDPAQNVDGGVRYLRMLLERYNGDLSKALAAYNAGPGAVDRFGGVPNFRETRDYVRKVTATYFAPGSERQASAMEMPKPIYRSTDANGRLVFTNE